MTTRTVNETRTMIAITAPPNLTSEDGGSWVEGEFVEFEMGGARVVVVLVGIWVEFEGDAVVEFAAIVVVLPLVGKVVFDGIVVLPAKEKFRIKIFLGRKNIYLKNILI